MDIARTIGITILLTLASINPSIATEVSLLTNSDYFPALDDKIKTAREEILVSMYLFRATEYRKNLATQLMNDLITAASKGVKVTVILEREAGGRRGSSLNEDNTHTAKILSSRGIKVYFDDPDTVTHTKLVIIDNRFVFIGSHNFSDSALERNNEASVIIDSPRIAKEASSFLRGIERNLKVGK